MVRVVQDLNEKYKFVREEERVGKDKTQRQYRLHKKEIKGFARWKSLGSLCTKVLTFGSITSSTTIGEDWSGFYKGRILRLTPKETTPSTPEEISSPEVKQRPAVLDKAFKKVLAIDKISRPGISVLEELKKLKDALNNRNGNS